MKFQGMLTRTRGSRTRTKDLSSWKSRTFDLSCNKHKSFKGTGVVRILCINAIPGATENARTDTARPPKLWRCKAGRAAWPTPRPTGGQRHGCQIFFSREAANGVRKVAQCRRPIFKSKFFKSSTIQRRHKHRPNWPTPNTLSVICS